MTPDSPSQRVGAPPLDRFESVRHSIPMQSLENAVSREEMEEWLERLRSYLDEPDLDPELVIEPKMDGAAVELVYENGRLTVGSTRGDGETGELITENLRTVRNVPLVLTEGESEIVPVLEVRGEVIVTTANFDALNRSIAEAGGDKYANPRNFAAGSLRLLDSRETASRPLEIRVYGLGRAEGLAFETHSESLAAISRIGFRTSDHVEVVRGLDAVQDYSARMEAARDTMPYEIDGIVVKVDDLRLQERLGSRSRSPRWAIAYKFPARQETTRLVGIDVQIGRTGAVTPVAFLEPVQLGGVEISRATLHNADEVERLGLLVGDTVLVERAGDVIPKVVKAIVSKRDGSEHAWEMPQDCPECGSKLVADSVVVHCPNLSCPARVKESIRHFASKGAMDIDGLGAKIVDQFVDRGLVSSIADLYRLDAETIAGLDRMGEKSAANLVEAFEKSKTPRLDRYLFGFGIRHVGERVARILAEAYPSLDALGGAPQEDLEAIHEVGPIVAASVHEFMQREDTQALLGELEELGLRPVAPEPAGDGDGVFAGKVVVFTGTLERFSRKEGQALVVAQGGRASSSVSSKTDCLVAGEKAGSKKKKAEELGVPVLTEDEFLAKVGADVGGS